MRVPSPLTIHEAIEPLLNALADKIVARLAAGTRPDMLDQAGSPLGRRRHIAAVRARVARGDAGAAIVGRRYLLTRDVLEAELQLVAKRKAKLKKAAQDDELAAARERYGLEQKGAA